MRQENVANNQERGTNQYKSTHNFMQIFKLTDSDFKYYRYGKENRRKDGQNG